MSYANSSLHATREALQIEQNRELDAPAAGNSSCHG